MSDTDSPHERLARFVEARVRISEGRDAVYNSSGREAQTRFRAILDLAIVRLHDECEYMDLSHTARFKS